MLLAVVLGRLDMGALLFPVLRSEGAEIQSLTLTQSGILAPGRRKCREWVEASLCASISLSVE